MTEKHDIEAAIEAVLFVSSEPVPRTRLLYDLGGRYDLFEATIGIDERGGPQAHAIFRVYGDGRMLYESPPMLLASAML